MTAVGVGLIVEDIRHQEFLVPAIKILAGAVGRSVEIKRCDNLRGCRPKPLGRRLASMRDIEIVLVGADAMGDGHQQRWSFRKKRNALAAHCAATTLTISYAVAYPSIEAWLTSDLPALAGALQRALSLPPRSPTTRRRPTREDVAKSELGAVVHEIVGAPLARSGFEYAGQVVQMMKLRDSQDDSLRTWAREFERHLASK